MLESSITFLVDTFLLDNPNYDLFINPMTDILQTTSTTLASLGEDIATALLSTSKDPAIAF